MQERAVEPEGRLVEGRLLEVGVSSGMGGCPWVLMACSYASMLGRW